MKLQENDNLLFTTHGIIITKEQHAVNKVDTLLSTGINVVNYATTLQSTELFTKKIINH
jgi:hypothetical protein